MSNIGQINQELAKWDNAVFYNVKFKENTTAPLNKLKDILKQSLSYFTIIAANSEALVYKIGRFFITQEIKFDDFNFKDGRVVKAFIGDESALWAKKQNVDKFFETFSGEFSGKWVVIPCMDFSIDESTSIYFINGFRRAGAIGVIFYSEGPDNIAENLVANSQNLSHFYQFPKADYYRPKLKKLPADEY